MSRKDCLIFNSIPDCTTYKQTKCKQKLTSFRRAECSQPVNVFFIVADVIVIWGRNIKKWVIIWFPLTYERKEKKNKYIKHTGTYGSDWNMSIYYIYVGSRQISCHYINKAKEFFAYSILYSSPNRLDLKIFHLQSVKETYLSYFKLNTKVYV